LYIIYKKMDKVLFTWKATQMHLVIAVIIGIVIYHLFSKWFKCEKLENFPKREEEQEKEIKELEKIINKYEAEIKKYKSEKDECVSEKDECVWDREGCVSELNQLYGEFYL
jgi:cell division protein FtsB